MWTMIQIKEVSEMFYNFQRDCNAKLDNANYILIRGQNQYWEHPFACSFYFYFDNFKKQKTNLCVPLSSFIQNEIKLNFSSTLNPEKKINM